jgi:hypothetical protein
MFASLEKMIDLPEGKIPNQTSVAPFDGKITSRKKLAAGGWRVQFTSLDGEKTKRFTVQPVKDIDPTLDELVPREPLAMGAVIKAGDRITNLGPVHPRDILEATNDVPRIQELMVDSIHGTLREGANDSLLRRHTEVIVRALTDRLEVVDPGKHPTLLPGEIIRSGMVKRLTAESNGTLKLKPRVIGSQKIPLHSTDWMVRIQANRVKDGLLDAAQMGFESYVNGYHPVPAYGFGLRFNQGPMPGY